VTCGARVCYSGLSSGCHNCARRRRYGFMAVAIAVVWESERESYAGRVDAGPFLQDAAAFYFDALDALAEIMEDRHRVIRQHRRDMNDEIREGQRAARDSYQEGRFDGERTES
jgi:hypothetical protein